MRMRMPANTPFAELVIWNQETPKARFGARRSPCERAAHRIGAARKTQFLFARPAPKIVERQMASGGDDSK